MFRSLVDQLVHTLIHAIVNSWLMNSSVYTQIKDMSVEIALSFSNLDLIKEAILDPECENVLDDLATFSQLLVASLRSFISFAEKDLADSIRFHMCAEDVEECDSQVRKYLAAGEFVRAGTYLCFLTRWMSEQEQADWTDRLTSKSRLERARFALAKQNFERYHAPAIAARFVRKYRDSM